VVPWSNGLGTATNMTHACMTALLEAARRCHGVMSHGPSWQTKARCCFIRWPPNQHQPYVATVLVRGQLSSSAVTARMRPPPTGWEQPWRHRHKGVSSPGSVCLRNPCQASVDHKQKINKSLQYHLTTWGTEPCGALSRASLQMLPVMLLGGWEHRR
jgi:hypothetical protein